MRLKYCASPSELSQLGYYFLNLEFWAVTAYNSKPRRSTCAVTNPIHDSAAERSRLLFQLYPIACSNSLTAQFSLLLLAWLRLHYFYDKWFVMSGPKRQTAPVTVCLHSKGEYQSLRCGRRSSWEQNLLPDPFFYTFEKRNHLLSPEPV
jgi:hypothetical protein